MRLSGPNDDCGACAMGYLEGRPYRRDHLAHIRDVAAQAQEPTRISCCRLEQNNPKNVLTLLLDRCPRVAPTINAIPSFVGRQVLGKLECERSKFHSKHDNCRNQAITRFDCWSLCVTTSFRQLSESLCKIDHLLFSYCGICDVESREGAAEQCPP